jgi:predicted acyltransferase
LDPKPARNLGLDIFRGLTVVLMLIVNNPGSWSHIYSPFQHPAWDGISLADLVFPFFLLAVGASVVFSLEKRIRLGSTKAGILIYAFLRFLVLVSIGLFLHAFPHFEMESLRIPGVLQRIGLVYLILVFLYLYSGPIFQYWLGVLVLGGYLYLIVFLPPPNWNGVGEFQFSPNVNWSAYLDSILFGESHVWKYSKPWDPEGFLSTYPAIVTGMIGFLVGKILRSEKSRYQVGNPFGEFSIKKSDVLILLGIIFTVLGLLLDQVFPIIKNLWSSSYVMFSAGLGLGFLGILSGLGVQSSVWNAWILVLGKRALFVFVFSAIFSRILILPTMEGTWKGYIFQKMSVFSDPFLNSFFYSFAYLVFVSLVTLIWDKIISRIKFQPSS